MNHNFVRNGQHHELGQYTYDAASLSRGHDQYEQMGTKVANFIALQRCFTPEDALTDWFHAETNIEMTPT